jgi:hypothetical protein
VVKVTVDIHVEPEAWRQIRQLFAADILAGLAILGDDPVARLWDHRPILLLEASDTLMVADPGSGTTYELQVELLTRRGFQRLAPDDAVGDPLAGWTLACLPGQVELRDQDGALWATADVVPDRRWLVAAEQGQVVVLYGACLGVVPPEGVRSWQYGPEQRAAEICASRRHGLIAAAAIRWLP